MIKAQITELIERAINNLGLSAGSFSVEHPADMEHGDYATNAALVIAKKSGANPKEIAEKIKTEIEKNQPTEIKNLEIAGPGFINFYLADSFLASQVREVFKAGADFGRVDSYKNQKTIIEYTDPNPFKEFHIGHLMSNAIGEAISRLVEFSGAEVRRACYQGDVGLHVAKAIWAARKFDLPLVSGEAYAHGAKAYEEDPQAKEEIVEINRKIYEQTDKEINQLYTQGRQQSLDYFETIYRRLGTKFDFYFFETESGLAGKKIVDDHIGKVFEKSDNAIVFRAENYDKSLHTRVFINSEGLPTYEAKELGLAKLKADRYEYDKSIVITGNEVNAYFRVLLQALKLIFPELAERSVHLSHGMMRLPTGKMSSRTGEVITGEWLIEEVKKQREGITDDIAVGAIKYSILKQDISQDIVFDFDKSLSLSGNSGPYLQYTFARTQSVLEKAGTQAGFEKSELPTLVEKLLYRFPEVVERAAREYAPHQVCTYLYELAGAFNGYYAEKKIVSDEPESAYRIALTAAVGQVIKNGLTLLGIQTPKAM